MNSLRSYTRLNAELHLIAHPAFAARDAHQLAAEWLS